MKRCLFFTVHAMRRMHKRGIAESDVRHVLDTGETIERYPGDIPYPSRLVLGFCGARPLHVVVAEMPASEKAIVVTVYEPSSEQWGPDFRKRRTL